MSTPANSPDSQPVEINARRGGWRTHKPNCQCRPCASHRRAKEAVPVSTGDGGAPGPVEVSVESLVPLVKRRHPKRNRPSKYNTGSKSPRARIATWLAIRAVEPHLTNGEIAERMGLSIGYLREIIYKSRKEGWLKFSDPMDQIEYDIVPKVVDNLNYFLDKKDRSVTIETAKGTIFKQYQESKGISDAPRTVLALKIEAPEPGAEPVVVAGRIVGKPREIE